MGGNYGIISIHAPRAGSDAARELKRTLPNVFQSTLPVRGATSTPSPPILCRRNFNPRSPCGERLLPFPTPTMAVLFQSTLPVRGATRRGRPTYRVPQNFNPRSPCGERRRAIDLWVFVSVNFNPRSPCGERRALTASLPHAAIFQSTLPVRGATLLKPRNVANKTDFNPRSPCGERHKNNRNPERKLKFQSTLPVRGATAAVMR